MEPKPVAGMDGASFEGAGGRPNVLALLCLTRGASSSVFRIALNGQDMSKTVVTGRSRKMQGSQEEEVGTMSTW